MAIQGGKAEGLQKLMGAGFRVPRSMFIPSKIVAAWVALLPDHDQAVRDWGMWAGEPAAGPDSLKRLREGIATLPPPQDWPELAARTLSETATGERIVRSNMSAEDAENNSFAGAFRSVRVFNPDADALWRAALEVVASAYEPQAALRLLGAGANPAEFVPGVLVQRYVVPRVAGVCFSRRPDAVWKDDGMMEWALGSGENVVQGTSRTHNEFRSADPGPKSPVAPFWNELWRESARAEALFGAPVDLEWVWDGHELWFVQARPIATEEARLLAESKGVRWTRALSLERFPEPVTPIGWTAIEDSMQSNLESLSRDFGVEVNASRKMAVKLRGRIYSDPDFFKFPSRVKVRWWRYLKPWGPHLGQLFLAAARHFTSVVFARNKPVARALFHLDLTQALIGPQARDWSKRWEAHIKRGGAELEKFKASWSTLDTEQPASGELLQRMERLREISLRFLEPDFTVFLVKDTLHKSLEKIWLSLGRPALGFADLVTAFIGNRTLGMSFEWVELIRQLSTAEKREEFLNHLAAGERGAAILLDQKTRTSWERFLERNGHCRTSWDVAVPSWSEEPEALVPLISASVEGVRAARGTFELQTKVMAGFREELGQAGLGPKPIERVDLALVDLKDFMRMDEELHFLTGQLLEPSRRLVLAAGELLVREGVLASAEDAFFLELAELKAVLRGKRARMNLMLLVARRRSEFARACRSEAPMDFPPADTAAAPGAEIPFQRSIQGVGVSAGVVEGTAMLMEHLDGARSIEPGSVLVTTAPNPAFVPLYPVLGGIVSVTGGMLSHGYVAAREFGLPGVSGVPDALTRFKNGMRLRVDGARGVVDIL